MVRYVFISVALVSFALGFMQTRHLQQDSPLTTSPHLVMTQAANSQ